MQKTGKVAKDGVKKPKKEGKNKVLFSAFTFCFWKGAS